MDRQLHQIKLINLVQIRLLASYACSHVALILCLMYIAMYSYSDTSVDHTIELKL